jgi:hypothetical protein
MKDNFPRGTQLHCLWSRKSSVFCRFERGCWKTTATGVDSEIHVAEVDESCWHHARSRCMRALQSRPHYLGYVHRRQPWRKVTLSRARSCEQYGNCFHDLRSVTYCSWPPAPTSCTLGHGERRGVRGDGGRGGDGGREA